MTTRILRILPSLLLLVLAGCATLSGPNTGYQPNPSERQLVGLIGQRLIYAYDVAWYKYQRQLPITDPVREAAVLKAMTAEGVARGVPAARVQTFFAAQMTASREFQGEVMEGWRNGSAPPGSLQVDLDGKIRPQITRVSGEMVGLLADPAIRFSPALADYAYQFLRQRDYSPNVANVASAALK